MELGDKIKRIRTFRGLTQRELGLRLGYGTSNADVRIAQYESGYRVPKKETLLELAKVLEVNPINFITYVSGSAEDIMQSFFWLEEANPGFINLFQLTRNSGKCNASEDTAVRYNDSDLWHAHAPMGMWFDNGRINGFMQDWYGMKKMLKNGEVTEEDYFEWKVRWPDNLSALNKLRR